MKNIRYISPSKDMVEKLILARQTTENMSSRKLRCAYCHKNTIYVYEDARGHLKLKCPQCKREAVYNVISMRRKLMILN